MSIYSTLWRLQFPRDGDAYTGCAWVEVFARLTKKETSRSGQEYESPLLVLSGAEYAAMSFQDLHGRLCDALRGSKPRLVLQLFAPGATPMLVFEDGSTVRRPDSNQE